MGTKWTSEEVKEGIVNLVKQGCYTQDEIASQFGVTRKVVHRVISANFTKEERHQLKRDNYIKSKIGDKNPMYGKKEELHHNFKGICSDGKGYMLAIKPDWYTGRSGSKHIFLHHLVICEHLGITEIPSGHSVHHIDTDKTNNDPSNLLLLTKSAHSKLHVKLRKEQRLSERSRGQVASKCVGADEVHDIV